MRIDIRKEPGVGTVPRPGRRYVRMRNETCERGTVFAEKWGFATVEACDEDEPGKFRVHLRRMTENEEEAYEVMDG